MVFGFFLERLEKRNRKRGGWYDFVWFHWFDGSSIFMVFFGSSLVFDMSVKPRGSSHLTSLSRGRSCGGPDATCG